VPALAAITRHLIAAEIVHFDETGFGSSGKLAWAQQAIGTHSPRG
jgi:hypothetical protein